MKFQYYQIRPCVEHDGCVHSFLGNPVEVNGKDDWQSTPENAGKAAKDFANTVGSTVLWTIYGIDEHGHCTAIGDHKSFDEAYKVLDAILMPVCEGINRISDHWHKEGYYGAPDGLTDIEDILGQSTNRDRL